MILQALANQFDERGFYAHATLLDQALTKTAGKLQAFHYPLREADVSSIKKRGLLAPSQLVKYPALFKSVRDNYRARIKAVYSGEITDEVVLDYLDYSRALTDDLFHVGRNQIFALLSPIPTGISDEHDKIAAQTPIKIDLKKVSKLPGAKFYLCELPLAEPGEDTKPVTIGDLRWLSNVNWMEFYDEKKAEGLLFGNVPHLAIYTKAGKIPADCLEFE